MIGQVPKASVDTFCVGYVTSYGSVWFLQKGEHAAYTSHQKVTSNANCYMAHLSNHSMMTAIKYGRGLFASAGYTVAFHAHGWLTLVYGVVPLPGHVAV